MIKVFINNLALIFFINDENYFIVIITFKLSFHSVLARFVAFVSLSGFFIFTARCYAAVRKLCRRKMNVWCLSVRLFAALRYYVKYIAEILLPRCQSFSSFFKLNRFQLLETFRIHYLAKKHIFVMTLLSKWDCKLNNKTTGKMAAMCDI